jgi:transcriptional regulator with XRE-family HTH domain
MALGMMQNDLSDAVNMPQGHISRLERGRFVTIHPDHLIDIARALKTSTDFLLGLTMEPECLLVREDARAPRALVQRETLGARPPVTLGRFLVDIDDVSAALAAGEGEAYR